MPRVPGRRARRKTQGSDARSEDIARGSSVNPKEGRRGRRPARSATRPRPLTYTTRTFRYRFREAHPYEPESDVISGVTESRPCSRLASLAISAVAQSRPRSRLASLAINGVYRFFAPAVIGKYEIGTKFHMLQHGPVRAPAVSRKSFAQAAGPDKRENKNGRFS